MIKHKKIPEDIEALLPQAISYLESNHNIIFAYLFGGLAKGKPLPLSDVDIAVYLNKNTDIIEEKLEMIGNLITILHTDEIDLVILNSSALPLKMRILENKKVIVDKAPCTRHVFESLTMRKYFDFSHQESNILRRRFLHG